MARTAQNKARTASTTAQASPGDKPEFVLTKDGRDPWKTTDRAEVVNLQQRGWKLQADDTPSGDDAA